MRFCIAAIPLLLLAWVVLPVESRGQSPAPIPAPAGTPAPEPESATDAPALLVERHLAAGGQGFFPVALRLKDERIAIVMRGGGPHLSIKGTLDIVFSSAEGRTWTPPVTVVDSEMDDRNPAFGQAADGALIVGYWKIATYDDAGKYDPNSDKHRSTHVIRSTDGGKTWSAPVEIDVSDIGIGSPYGRIVTLSDATLLMAIYGYEVLPAGAKREGDRNHSYVYQSKDNGLTWNRLSEIGDGKMQFNETTLIQLPGGKLKAALRSRSSSVWIADSMDDGKTWTMPAELTVPSVHPADLCLLKNGRLLLTVGCRVKPYGVLGIVSDAEGRFDWETRFSLMLDAAGGDCGYPSNVLLKDGRVLTAYYATKVRGNPDWGVHCGVMIFKTPK